MVLLASLGRRVFLVRRKETISGRVLVHRFLFICAGATTLGRLTRFTFQQRGYHLFDRRISHFGTNARFFAKGLGLKGAIRRVRRYLFVRVFRYFQYEISRRCVKDLSNDVMVFLKVGRSHRFLYRAFLRQARVQYFFLFFSRNVGFFLKRVNGSLSVFNDVNVTRIRPRLMRFVEEYVATVRPGITELDLTRLTSINFHGRQTNRDGDLAARLATSRLHANHSIAPLINSSRLRTTTFIFVRVRVVMSLGRLMERFHGQRASEEFTTRTFFGKFFDRRVIGDSVLASVTSGVRREVVLRPIMVICRLNDVEHIQVRVRGLKRLLLGTVLIVAGHYFVRRVAFHQLR